MSFGTPGQECVDSLKSKRDGSKEKRFERRTGREPLVDVPTFDVPPARDVDAEDRLGGVLERVKDFDEGGAGGRVEGETCEGGGGKAGRGRATLGRRRNGSEGRGTNRKRNPARHPSRRAPA